MRLPREPLDDYFSKRPQLTDAERYILVKSNLDSIVGRRPRPQHTHLPSLPESLLRSDAARLDLPPPVDRVTTMVPVQIDPKAAFETAAR